MPDIEVETEENDNSAEECEDEEQANDVEMGANDGRTGIKLKKKTFSAEMWRQCFKQMLSVFVLRSR